VSDTPTDALLNDYSRRFQRSQELYATARTIFPNGVTHDARYLEPFPPYVREARGAYKWTVEGHRLIDWWSGHGALMLGHSPEPVVRAVQEQMERGTHPGASHELELRWGQLVQELVPSAERIRFTSSGTEATMMALRLARMYTGRPRVLKFLGHFHGWNDFLIQGADPPFDEPVPGLLDGVREGVVCIPPGDLELVETTLRANPDIGCVILEPTGGHYGLIPCDAEFVRGLRRVTERQGVLLIMDEVITGFRVHPGGAQGRFGVKPDLSTFAKILAGGLPGGCVAGRKEIVDLLAFGNASGQKMPHPGTFNANPLSASAGIATLELVMDGRAQEHANAIAARLRIRLNRLFRDLRVPWVAYGAYSDFYLYPKYGVPPTGDDVRWPEGATWLDLATAVDRHTRFLFRVACLMEGVDLPGLRGMANAAHTEDDVEFTVAAVGAALERLRGVVWSPAAAVPS